MGRCYEFGVVVGQGCDHPMVVASDGSACACSECGALCKGRFDGCAAVLARPGYSPVVTTVPVSIAAPRVRPPASSVAVAVAPAVPEVPAVEVPLVAEAPEPVVSEQPVMDSIDALRRDLETRDVALGEAFERLITSYDRLMEGVAADREARDRLIGAVELLAERLAELEGRDPAPLFPFRRDA